MGKETPSAVPWTEALSSNSSLITSPEYGKDMDVGRLLTKAIHILPDYLELYLGFCDPLDHIPIFVIPKVGISTHSVGICAVGAETEGVFGNLDVSLFVMWKNGNHTSSKIGQVFFSSVKRFISDFYGLFHSPLFRNLFLFYLILAFFENLKKNMKFTEFLSLLKSP